MRNLTVAALSIFFAAQVATAAEVFTNAQPGMWSTRGVYLWPGPTAIADHPPTVRQLRIASPDQKTALHVSDVEAHLTFLNGKQTAAFPIQSLAEILWAPDSAAFALTESDGGWVGSWSVRLAQISSAGQILFHEITDEVSKEFSARISKSQCAESTNIAAVAWANRSEQLLLVAEAPPHSSCPVMGQVCGYLVAVPSGKIRRRIGGETLRKEMEQTLGPRLRDNSSEAAASAANKSPELDCHSRLR